jgi:hypothetical protein
VYLCVFFNISSTHPPTTPLSLSVEMSSCLRLLAGVSTPLLSQVKGSCSHGALAMTAHWVMEITCPVAHRRFDAFIHTHLHISHNTYHTFLYIFSQPVIHSYSYSYSSAACVDNLYLNLCNMFLSSVFLKLFFLLFF